jgi:hypothetical protein
MTHVRLARVLSHDQLRARRQSGHARAFVYVLNTDSFLGAHYAPVLYEFEPASPYKALDGCLKSLDNCQVYLLIIGSQYGTLAGNLSITHANTGAPTR